MSIKTFFSFMVPKDRRFFPLFVQAANNAVDTSELLIKLIREPDFEKRIEYSDAIKTAEHKGDDITKSLLNELNGTFITPFDREDIHELITNLDTVVDLIYTTATRITRYKLPHFPDEFVQIADCIHSANKEIQYVLRSINTVSDFIRFRESYLKISQLESDADDLYQKFFIDLYDTEENAIMLIKKRDILISLEKAMDKCEDVSGIFSSLMVKFG
jgi:uncharacterized protein